MSINMSKMEVVLLLLLGTIDTTKGSNIYIINEFEIDSTRGAFSHMVMNTKTGNIYVGAMNNLYHLSSNLTLIKSKETGPRDDNPNCPPYTSGGCERPKQPMNAYNKALVIDYISEKLIACSSLFHGICQRYNLSDIGSKSPDIFTPVVANNARSSTVAFIAPGPTEYVLESNVLYVAASRTNAGKSIFRDLVPAIASRKLDNFDLFHKNIGTSSSKSIESMLRDIFPVYYIYGFGSEKFSYFVTVQKQNPTTKPYISKLIRVCQADKEYYSYAEVQLKCMHNGALYNLVQAAYVSKAGSSLAKTMGISELEDVLYVVCSIGNPNTAIPGSDSALCIYPLRTVRKIFTENIKACFDGIGNTGPSHIISQVVCRKTRFNISDDYCGTYDVNTPIDGTTHVQAEAAITFNTTASSVAVTTEFQDTIAFIGTVNGHIIKVAIKSGQMAVSYEDMTVEDGSKIYADMFFDSDKQHLYAFTDRKIYQIEVAHCSQYTTCKSCLGAIDPYCGWCSLENKCSQRKQCESHEPEFRWLSSVHACPTITHVVPDKIQPAIHIRRIKEMETDLRRYQKLHQDGIRKIQVLERELTTHKNVLEEFRLACSAFKQERIDRNCNSPFATEPDLKQTTAGSMSGIAVESVDAVVASSDHIYIIVKYKTIERHHVLWAYNIRGQMIPIQDGDHLGSVHLGENTNPGKTALKINKTALYDVELLYLKVLSEVSEVTLVFRMSAITGGGNQNVPDVEFIHASTSDIMVNRSLDLTLKVTVKSNNPTVTGLLNFMSIDNSVSPPLLLDLQGNDPRLNGTMVDVAGGKEWTVTMDSSLAALGGLLSFRVMVLQEDGIISQMYIGKTFHIYPESREASKSPFPENSVALLSIYGPSGSTLIIKPPVGALWCYAFGSPSPMTKISRINFDGSRTLMNGTMYSSGKYDSATAITFQRVKKDIEGMYICEAASRKSRREEFIQIRINI